MPPPLHCLLVTLACGALAAVLPPPARAGQTVAINATVLEVQCTAAQRARIRACASALDTYSMEPGKSAVAQRAPSGEAPGNEPRYEIRLDPARPVLIKTVLY